MTEIINTMMNYRDDAMLLFFVTYLTENGVWLCKETEFGYELLGAEEDRRLRKDFIKSIESD
jgi:hypothetical protein